MPVMARDVDLKNRFLEELSLTLDIRQTIKKLNITEEDAREILESFIVHKKAPLHKDTKGICEAYVDGASRGNPGEAGAGAVIKDPEGKVIKKLKKYLGVTTNNMAEYQALIMALEAARNLEISSLKIFADSELMVKQLNGEYQVRSPDLRPLFEKAVGLLRCFKYFKIKHVYREENSIADSLANEAIDGRG